jgi:hypothetical protein
MAQNFIESCREQGFLLPPDVRESLPADHLAWFVIDAVAQMDLAGFYATYRADGHRRAAYEPSMMVTHWCCKRTRPGSGHRGRSSVTAARTWRTG